MYSRRPLTLSRLVLPERHFVVFVSLVFDKTRVYCCFRCLRVVISLAKGNYGLSSWASLGSLVPRGITNLATAI